MRGIGFARRSRTRRLTLRSRLARAPCATQVDVIDAKGHLFGRLASIVSKQLLQGQHVGASFVRSRAFARGMGAFGAGDVSARVAASTTVVIAR